jgi:hypothetical protein
MLVLEDSDEDRLYLAKGVPREWIASGKEIGMEQAPTRWGRVSFRLAAKSESRAVVGHVEFTGASTPKQLHFKIRLPAGSTLQSVSVNGTPATVGGIHRDTVIIATGTQKMFEVVGQFN